MITVYTCIFNGYDILQPPMVISKDVRYVCFTDIPIPRVEPWEIQPAHMIFNCPRRCSRVPKILPHLHFNTEYSIWYDGALCMNVAPEQAVDYWLKDSDIAMFRHTGRTNIRQEREACIHFNAQQLDRFGDPDEITAQVEGYHNEGFPEDYGLWAGGVILRRHTIPIEFFNETWWKAYLNGSVRDQIALPYAIWKTGVNITTISSMSANALDHDGQVSRIRHRLGDSRILGSISSENQVVGWVAKPHCSENNEYKTIKRERTAWNMRLKYLCTK